MWNLPGAQRPKSILVLLVTNEYNRMVVDSVSEMLARTLGLRLAPINLGYNDLFERQRKRDFVMCLEGWQGGSVEGFLNRYRHDAGTINTLSYHSDQFDKLLTEALAADDEEARLAAFAKAETVLLKDAAVIPLGQYRGFNLVASHVQGYLPSAHERNSSRFLSVTKAARGR